MRNLWVVLVLSVLSISGCANQSYVKTEDRFQPTGWERIVVVPFAGKGQHVELATNTFAMQMIGEKHFILVQPEETRVKLTQLGVVVGSGTISILEAQKVARVFNAQGVIMGSIDTYNNGMTLNAFATVRIVDAATGQIVAATHQPSGLLMAYSEQQCITAATENAAKEINKVLVDLAKRNVPLPARRVAPEKAQDKEI